MIFKEKQKWTRIAIGQDFNLILVGDDLYSLFDDPERPAYLALIEGDKRDIRDYPQLWASFKAHDLKANRKKIIFKESNITLNIQGALYTRDTIKCTLEKLFSDQRTHLRSASLY